MMPKKMLLRLLFVLFCMSVMLKKTRTQNYEKFKNKHMVEKLDPNKNKPCKNENTFIIIDNEKDVKNICKSTLKHKSKNKLYTCSDEEFKILECTHKKDCVYKGERKTMRVVVTCEKGLPVTSKVKKCPAFSC
uniref:Ribonuclease A-domain domain-containing protein n=1 Tax=Cyprinodon variegatus TaxID=28743 RepID=A0A3Q2DM78_CYPVA